MDNNNRIIGLVTDFGPKGSHYVAAMKAVILSINPEVQIIDIHHNISSYSIIETSFIINSIYKFFPQNSIFVVVVDPGVGSSRKILALKTISNHYFVGPDNGIFWLAFAENGIKECIQIQNEKFYHQPVSDTFHGRDIMAPIGAYISKNISLNKFGARLDPKKLTSYPITYDISRKNNSIHCMIQFIDNFGNIVTNIPIIDEKIKGTNFILQKGSTLMLETDESKYQGILQSEYKNTELNQLFFIKGSSGYLEISMNQDSAAEKLNLKAGDSIQIRF